MRALIIGQGLAGSCMALELLGRGVDATIADPNRVNNSTSLAAGLINPLVLKRMKKVWRADEFIEYANLLYGKWEKELQCKWRQSVPVYRKFHDVAEQNRWMELSADLGLQEYINPVIEDMPNAVHGNFGMGKVIHAGWFDTQSFMDDVRSLLRAKNDFHSAAIKAPDLHFDSSWLWNGANYDFVVWANGTGVIEVPGFPTDALRPSKGELLRLKLHEMWPTDAIIKAGVFILPLGRKELRIGATYDHWDLEPGISEKGQNFLERQAADLIKVPYEIVGREWGIRPTTKDRRPILGRHAESDRIYFFNGLGSRGVLMAPLLAKELADHIMDGVGLRPDVDVARFY
ncbi:MAG: FAD-binding oxidoreductase [Flavobacteriales bacterium]|nr:FAD-binding oxidoreductase [Flavobacteriales bacterium]